mgnify:CR=1 FL=1
MSNVLMYVKDGCPYCAAAIKHYTDQGITFEQINVQRVPGAKEKVLELTGGTAIVPVIIEDGQVKKGFGGG